MRLLILGAGAVGLSVAARLSPFSEISTVCRPQHADVVNRSGFRLHGIWGEGNFRFHASSQPPTGKQFDYCLITCKSHQTRQLCKEHAGLLAQTEVVSLQNGIGGSSTAHWCGLESGTA